MLFRGQAAVLPVLSFSPRNLAAAIQSTITLRGMYVECAICIFLACLPESMCLFLRAGMSVVYRAVCTSCSLTIKGNARGLGVTCYSHNGKDLYCSKPVAGQCFTTGGWCPPDFGGDDEILPTEGVRAPPNPALLIIN